jgi:hypothetical protein
MTYTGTGGAAMSLGLMQVRLVSGVAVIALVLLLVTDAIGLSTFIVLIVIEALVTMGLSFWLIRKQQQERSLPPTDLQHRIDHDYPDQR